jgi:hypothetical protein
MPLIPPDKRPPITTAQPGTSAGFRCPHCGREVTQGRRLSYPASAVGAYAPVYRCGCGKITGAPVALLHRDEW